CVGGWAFRSARREPGHEDWLVPVASPDGGAVRVYLGREQGGGDCVQPGAGAATDAALRPDDAHGPLQDPARADCDRWRTGAVHAAGEAAAWSSLPDHRHRDDPSGAA